MPLLPSIPSLRPKPSCNDRLETKTREEAYNKRFQERKMARERCEKEFAENNSQEQNTIRKAAEEEQRIRREAAERGTKAEEQANKKQEITTSKGLKTQQEVHAPHNEKTIPEIATKDKTNPPTEKEHKPNKTVNPENLKTNKEPSNVKPARRDKELPSIPYDPILKEKYGIFYD